MQEQILNLKNEAFALITGAKDRQELENFRIAFLGKKGKFTSLLKEIPKLPDEKKARIGRMANEVKQAIQNAISNQGSAISNQGSAETNWFDVTAPGTKPPQGHLHLVTQTIREITTIFEKIGFVRVRYPEVEWDWYAFEGLNMPNNHPARDEWETFFIQNLKSNKYGEAVLTPHTSSGQLREMERIGQPPIRMLNIAKCYRRQSDASHAPMFYQFEGLVVDKDISIPHLKGTLDYFVKQYFGPERETRIRPYHFRFTEPSFEFDVTCSVCNGKTRLASGQKCKACKEGWVEIGGSGMVHPAVLKNGGVDPKKYTGFAFGWGVERVLMMKYKIPDIRLLFSGDLGFLQQF